MKEFKENFTDAYRAVKSVAEWKTLLVGYGANGVTKSAYIKGSRHVWLTTKGAKELLGIDTKRTIEDLKTDIEAMYIADAKKLASRDYDGIKASLAAYENRLAEKKAKTAERIALQAQTDKEKEAMKKFMAEKKAKMAQEAREYLESIRKPVLEAARPILVKAEHK